MLRGQHNGTPTAVNLSFLDEGQHSLQKDVETEIRGAGICPHEAEKCRMLEDVTKQSSGEHLTV
jgi:hypothetical protein